MYDFEIVRLCALWDQAGIEKDSIPTVVELIDDPLTIDALTEQARSAEYQQPEYVYLNLSPDPERQPSAMATDGYLGRTVEADAIFGELRNLRASQTKAELTKAIASARSIYGEPRFKGLRSYRNEHLAHSLTLEKEEATPLKYGYPLELFDASILIVQKLHWGITGNSFSISESQKINRQCAEALWNRCRFEVE
jgi:hypothetical protein